MSERWTCYARSFSLLAARQKRTALIGATAMAVNGIVRGTEDVDCAILVFDPRELARHLQTALPAYRVRLTESDEMDPLDGVIEIEGDDILPIELVNFANPRNLNQRTPAREAIDHSVEMLEGVPVVTPEYLIALKLYGSPSRQDEADVERLLQLDELDIELVTEICERFGSAEALEKLVTERQ